MKKLLLISMLFFLLFSCNKEKKVNYNMKYKIELEIINDLMKINLCNYTIYDKAINSFNLILSKSTDSVLNSKVIKSRDSLLNMSLFLKENNIKKYCFKSENHFNEISNVLNSFKERNIDFCKIYNQLKMFNKQSWDLAKEEYPEDFEKQGDFANSFYNGLKDKYIKELTDSDFVMIDYYGFNVCN